MITRPGPKRPARERRCVLFGRVVFAQFFWPAALQQLTGLLADGTSVPMATVHFAAMTGALLAGCMAVRTER